MSKSYNNTLPIFGEEKALRKKVMRIVTDSAAVEDPKPVEGSVILDLFKLFATAEEYNEMVMDHKAGGIGYGDFKKRLWESYWNFFASMRERRQELVEAVSYTHLTLPTIE